MKIDENPDGDAVRKHEQLLQRERGQRAWATRRRRLATWEWTHPLGHGLYHCVDEPTIHDHTR